jgi:hypothetical protein
VPWVEVFVVFIVCHMAGDFLLQTDWQARHKHGGCGRDPLARRALAMHILTYTLCFVPACVWIGLDQGAALGVATAPLIAVPHFIQDDGRLVEAWGRRVKKLGRPPSLLYLMVDQSFHVVTLFGTALLVSAL